MLPENTMSWDIIVENKIKKSTNITLKIYVNPVYLIYNTIKNL